VWGGGGGLGGGGVVGGVGGVGGGGGFVVLGVGGGWGGGVGGGGGGGVVGGGVWGVGGWGFVFKNAQQGYLLRTPGTKRAQTRSVEGDNGGNKHAHLKLSQTHLFVKRDQGLQEG